MQTTLTLDVPPFPEQITVEVGGQQTTPTDPLAIEFKLGRASRLYAYSGESLTLSGTGFDPVPANNTVTLGGLAATVTGGTTNSLTFDVPAGFIVPGDIVVTNTSGTITGPNIKAFHVPNVFGYWPGDSTDMNKVASPHGKITGGVYGAGKVGNAFHLSGVLAGPHVKTSVRVPNVGMTFMAWVKPSEHPVIYLVKRRQVMSTAGGYGWSVLGYYHSAFLPPCFFGLCTLTDLSRWHVFNGITARDTTFKMTKNTWQHIAAVFDKTNGQVRFYKNGSEKILPGLGNVGNAALIIGKNPINLSENFPGAIDEVYLIKGELTKAEIVNYYNKTK